MQGPENGKPGPCRGNPVPGTGNLEFQVLRGHGIRDAEGFFPGTVDDDEPPGIQGGSPGSGAGRPKKDKTGPSYWLQVLMRIPPAASEAAGGALFESGAESVWEDEPDELGRLVLKAAFGPSDAMRLMAEAPEALLSISEAFGYELGPLPPDGATPPLRRGLL